MFVCLEIHFILIRVSVTSTGTQVSIADFSSLIQTVGCTTTTQIRNSLLQYEITWL